MTDEEIRAVVEEYDDAIRAATHERDEALRHALAAGRRQVDIIRATGYSRETVRQILDPAARESANERRRKRSG